MNEKEGIRKVEYQANSKTIAEMLDKMCSSDRKIEVGRAVFVVLAAMMESDTMDIFDPLKSKLTVDEYEKFKKELTIMLSGTIYAASFETANEGKKAMEKLMSDEPEDTENKAWKGSKA